MTKIYKSHSQISISVVLIGGTSKHISFVPCSDGSSKYITDNKDEQDAIERHHNFGRLFKLLPQAQPKMKTAAKVNDKKSNEPVTVKVPDMQAAKDYLAEHFEVNRTKVKTVSDIKKQAEKHNIIFDGI